MALVDCIEQEAGAITRLAFLPLDFTFALAGLAETVCDLGGSVVHGTWAMRFIVLLDRRTGLFFGFHDNSFLKVHEGS
jgi:hypothetical protein